MRIRKFYEFIKEEVLNDPAQTYIKSKLKILQNDFDKMFDGEKKEDESEISPQQAKVAGKRKEKEENLLNGFYLVSNDISLYSELYDSLTVKFTNDEFEYHLIIQIPSVEAIPKDTTKSLTLDDIKNCEVTFKKYNNASEIIGTLPKQSVEIEKVNPEFIIKLIGDLDKLFKQEEEFGIETED